MDREVAEAASLFEEVLAINAEEHTAQAGLAVCKLLSNNLIAAKNLAQQSVSAAAPPSLAFVAHGMVADREGDVKQAGLDFVKALEEDPQSVYGRYILSTFLCRSEYLDEGINMLRQLSEENPRFWMARRNLAMCYAAKGIYRLALREALATTRHKPSLSNLSLLVPYALDAYPYIRWIPAAATFLFLMLFPDSMLVFVLLMVICTVFYGLTYLSRRQKWLLVLLFVTWCLGALYYVIHLRR